jgi:pimeloyl-ACP methyl ester carboxylesterase
MGFSNQAIPNMSFAHAAFRKTALFTRALFVMASLLASLPAAAAGGQAVTESVNGRTFESKTLRHPDSKAVVVFENGARATLDSWDGVAAAVSPSATVFTYNRPGYANSAASDTPRDGATIVEELRATLKRKGLAPPYVLVGHSLGGLYMQLFARRYPQEVKGLVLVDALYPRVVKKPEEFPLTTRLGKWLFFSNTVQREIDAIHATGEAVLALPGIDDKPIIRLINQPKGSTAIAVDFGAFNFDPQTLALVRGLYPKAKTIVADSSHQMQVSDPQLVAGAIWEVLAAGAR